MLVLDGLGTFDSDKSMQLNERTGQYCLVQCGRAVRLDNGIHSKLAKMNAGEPAKTPLDHYFPQ